jgi:hypothetical protein
MSRAAEAARQQALLRALWVGRVEDREDRDRDRDGGVAAFLHEHGERAAQGLRAYRANAGALADRALTAVFGTVREMVGADNFEHLAHEYALAQPPDRGDMGEWGAEFPAWIEAHAAFREWPYLGDCARVDWAVHRCERAADAEFDAASFARLESDAPERLLIVPMPGTAVLASAWPIVAMHRAHHPEPGEATEAAFADVRAALHAQAGEQALVARSGWRAHVHAVDAATMAWTRLLLEGVPLGTALEQCGSGFDFVAWLTRALREGWLKEVRRLSD